MIRPVIGVVGAGLMDLNDDEDVLEVGADGLWREGQGAGLLEHDRYNVVTDVSLPQQLERQNRDTERFIKEAGTSLPCFIYSIVIICVIIYLSAHFNVSVFDVLYACHFIFGCTGDAEATLLTACISTHLLIICIFFDFLSPGGVVSMTTTTVHPIGKNHKSKCW